MSRRWGRFAALEKRLARHARTDRGLHAVVVRIGESVEGELGDETRCAQLVALTHPDLFGDFDVVLPDGKQAFGRRRGEHVVIVACDTPLSDETVRSFIPYFEHCAFEADEVFIPPAPEGGGASGAPAAISRWN